MGSPSPRVVGRGNVSETRYVVLAYIEGSAVDEHADLTAWETLGQYGRLAHELEWTSGPEALFTRFRPRSRRRLASRGHSRKDPGPV